MSVQSWPSTQMLCGYVTRLSAIKNFDVPTLENRLGFSSGTLAAGYAIYGLAARVEMDDYEWRDQTRYSGGLHADPSIHLHGDVPGTVWMVPRMAELRASLGARFNYDEKIVDAEIMRLKNKWLDQLNICYGHNRIVKVVSNINSRQYPNSRYSGIPQWEIKCGNKKLFKLLYSGGNGGV